MASGWIAVGIEVGCQVGYIFPIAFITVKCLHCKIFFEIFSEYCLIWI